jgi:alkylation response protein AidB-like acyl-CoA dehydrogenase
VRAVWELRRQDYELSSEQQELRDSFRAYFEKSVGAQRVRDAEPLGFDEALWKESGPQFVSMALSEAAAGDGAGLVDLALVVEEAGRAAAPIPVVESMVGARALERLAPTCDLLDKIATADGVVTVCPGSGEVGRRLVPAGAVAEAVIGLRGTDVVLVTGSAAPLAPNLGCAPLGWWDVVGGTVIGTANDFAAITTEWQLLTAAALVGLAQAALDIGVRYAKERSAFGTQIGAFQAIAHPLADAAGAVEGARRLMWRAAWFAENEPDALGVLDVGALLSAATAAEKAGAVAIHTQGGFGVTLESDAQLYYRRAKGWALMAGERRALLAAAADRLLGPSEAVR